MHSQRLLVVSLILLPLLFFSACGGGASPVPGPPATQGTTNLLVVNSTLSTLQIKADLPPMQVKHQTLITVSIFPTGGPMPVSEVQVVKNATSIVTNATPVGTPGQILINAFGPDHTVDATATLETTPDILSVAPPISQTKPLDQARVEWNWLVTPLVDGPQYIGVDIEVNWTSTTSGQRSLPYTLGFPKFQVSVQPLTVVSTPTPTPPPDRSAFTNILVQIIAALIGAIGAIAAALLTIPSFRRWLRGRLQKPK